MGFQSTFRVGDGDTFPFPCSSLVRMHSILSLKKSRNVLARDDASGDSGSEFEGFR